MKVRIVGIAAALLVSLGSGQTQKPTVQQLMLRMRGFVLSCHSLEAQISVSCARLKGPGIAKMIYVRPDKLYYSVYWPPLNWRFIGNSHGCWDADYLNRIYDENTDWRFEYPGSRFAGAPRLIMPGFLMDGTFLSDQIARIRYVGSSKINGQTVDQIEGQGESRTIEVFLTADGRPVRYITRTGQVTPIEVTGDITYKAINRPEPSSLFVNNPPVGFKEDTVPLAQYPLTPKRQFPLQGWRSSSGDFASAVGHRMSFVMLTVPGCEPSSKAGAALKTLNDAGLNVFVGSLEKGGGVPTALAGFPRIYDPKGANIERINCPGTPFFYLLNKAGTIVKSWYGYDSDDKAAFIADVESAAKTPKNP